MFTDFPGPLRAVDARIKLAWLLATTVAGVVFTNIPSLLIILGTILVVAWLGRILRPLLINLKSLWLIVIVIGLIFSVTVSGEPLFFLIPKSVPLIGGHLPVTREGVLIGIVSVLRMFIFALPMVVVIMSTNNSDLLRGLLFARLPMEVALMIVLALNFIPLYLEEMARIADAQRARAHSLMDKGFFSKMRAMVPIFVPLTLNAVDRADTIGKVLEIRGFSRRSFTVEFDNLNRNSVLLGLYSLALAAVALLSLIFRQDLLLAGLRRLIGS